MREFYATNVKRRRRGFRAVAAVTGLVLIGGVAFATAGGGKAVKQLLVTLTLISEDGSEVQTVDAILEQVGDGEDQAVVNVTLGEGRDATVIMRSSGDGQETFQTTGDAGADNAVGNIVLRKVTAADIGSTDAGTMALVEPKFYSLEDLPEALWIADWLDENGEPQELHIVANPEGAPAGLRVMSSFTADDGQWLFREVGRMFGVDPVGAELVALEVTEGLTASIELRTSEDGTVKLIVDLLDRPAESTDAARIRLQGERGQTIQVHVQPVNEDATSPGANPNGTPK